MLCITYCFFTSCWLAHNQLSWNVLLFSCNLIGQLCLSGPSYSICTVTNDGTESSFWSVILLEINHKPFSASALVKVTGFCLETVASKMVKKSCKKWKVIKLKNYCGTNDCEKRTRFQRQIKHNYVPVSLRLRMYPLGDINCDKNSTSYGTRIN